MRKVLKIGGISLGILVLVLLAYVIYMLVTYYRLEDNLELEVGQPEAASAGQGVKTDTEYGILTYNIGFGAYTPQFSFFMDGGKYSWGESRQSVEDTVKGAAQLLKGLDADFMMVQEIDVDGTRSYHVNEFDMFKEAFPESYSVFAQNYDSSFLAYPFHQPHGRNKAGLGVFSRYPVTSAVRRSLPVSDSISKFLDLDRCYSVSRVKMENGRELVLINLHMSAYGNSDEIREGQVSMLCAELEKEYNAGNYVICGGDFNHDLKASESDLDKVESWAYPFPRKSLPEHFAFAMDYLPQEEKIALWDSARNADMEYVAGETFTVTLDGFIISDNIEPVSYEVVNTGYRYSDHEPVLLKFLMK